MPTRTSSALWEGNLRDGSGTMKLGSGAFEGSYSFVSRFESGPGTNPEELIAAAHAGCFTMALAFQLTGAGHAPEKLDTKAEVSLEQEGAGWKIAASTLTLKAKVPGISKAEFDRLAEAAEKNCPVSKVLNAKITLNATLE
jgi:osmotically inducible protein OsmC